MILGLCGELPERIDPASLEQRLATIRELRTLPLCGFCPIGFQEPRDLLFHKDQTLPQHSNGMRSSAFDQKGIALSEAVYYSIGGGFIVREGDESTAKAVRAVPHPFGSAAELLDLGDALGSLHE